MEKEMARRTADGIRKVLEESGPEQASLASLADLHMHSNASDGTDEPPELMKRARLRGVRIAGLTDHDTVAGAESLLASPVEEVHFVPGIEFSCKDEGGKCHILGYACDFSHPDFQAALKEGRELRLKKLGKRLDFLEEEGYHLPRKETDQLWEMAQAGQSVGKPHLGNLLVRYGMARDLNQAIQEIINRCPTKSARIKAEMAVSAIRASGGIPVWAHPMGGEGEKRMECKAFQCLLERLLGYGLQGLECFYSRFPLELCEWLAEEAGRRGLYVSGGSDCHGDNKSVLAGTLNKEKIPVSPKRLTILPALADRFQALAGD